MAIVTIPSEDIDEAIRRGYTHIRLSMTWVNGEIVGQRTQVRTGFDPDTALETWKDLYPVEPTPLDALLQKAAERAEK